MKKNIKIILLFIFTSLIISCKNEKSLQQYLVDAPDKKGFVVFDVPVSSVLTPKTGVSDEIKETIQTIKKVNVTFLQKKDNNTEAYNKEKSILRNILKNEEYKSLMSMKMKGMSVNLYFSGNTDQIDEIIAFGYGDKVGLGIARLLGENMNPVKITEMMQNVKVDEDGLNLKQFSAIFE